MPHYERMAADARRFMRAAVLGRALSATAAIGLIAACPACSSEEASGSEPIDGAGGTGGMMATATGGRSAATGGSHANTGSGGVATSTGGSHSDSGAASSTGGASGSERDSGSSPSDDVDAGHPTDAGQHTKCKRGIATNTAPGAAFFPAITWWYNWSMSASGPDTGIEFVPMTWGKADVAKPVPAGSSFLLTFNEPNFHAQSNLTAQEAASDWPTIEAKANAAGVPIVGPGMNFCGPAENCNGTSPYQYLRDFFAACSDCQVDYVAVHWYNCDLPSLRDYLEPGGNLEGFEQFDKPIWLTEFSCNGSASVADQEAFMREAIPYLESNPHVFRYSWFSAGPIPNAKLMNDDGSPNALGTLYASLAQSCDE